MLDVVWERPKKPNGIIRGYYIYWHKLDSNIVKNATVYLPNKQSFTVNYEIHGLGENGIYR